MNDAVNRPGEAAVDPQISPPLAAPWEDRFHGMMLAVAAVTIGMSLYAHHFLKLTVHPIEVFPLFLFLLVLVTGALQYRWRGEHRCYNILMMVLWAIVITNFHMFPMYMAARRDIPMSDATLAAIDQAMGMEVPDVLEFLRPYPRINQFLQLVYNSLLPLMTLATVGPPLLNRMDKAKEYALASLIAAVIGMLIFATFQAVGPWEYYDFPSVVPSLQGKSELLAELKSDAWFVIDLDNRDGLIEFPSFHVILTVLATATLWAFPKLRWPVCLWATLIVASTVTTGIHYVADVVSGLLIAAFAYICARTLIGGSSVRASDVPDPSAPTSTGRQRVAQTMAN
jgi:membrane-associated phospholipid phosphatase